jgi:hypothetical protein
MERRERRDRVRGARRIDPGQLGSALDEHTNASYTWTAKGGRQYARVQAKCNGQFGSSSNEVEYTVGN